MPKIIRAAGDAPGRSGGTAYNGLAWAVGVSPDKSPDMYLQTEKALSEVDRVLVEMGTDKTALISSTVYIAKMQLKEEMDQAWRAWIGDDSSNWPQRACIETPLYRYTLVEIVVIAACPNI